MAQPTPVTIEIDVKLGDNVKALIAALGTGTTAHTAKQPSEVADQARIIRTYLEHVDSAALEAEALTDGNVSQSVTERLLAALWAHADDPIAD
jgi:hypothetical protein